MKLLVVEDDRKIKAETIDDVLASLGHECDWAQNQQEANTLLLTNDYDLILMDLQIPSRPGGKDSAEFGRNLLRQIRTRTGREGVPVVLMTAQHQHCVDLMTELQEIGIDGSIAKPFPASGRTLAVVIEEVIARRHAPRQPARMTGSKEVLTPFAGGELAFYPDRVELCGVTVVSRTKSGQMWAIINTLINRLANGRYKAFSGKALATIARANGGQPGVAGSVRDFRRYVTEQLARELGLNVGPHDVVETVNGYRLNAWIKVNDLRNPVSKPSSSAPDSEVSTDLALERQARILERLRTGERLRAPALADQLRCSHSTVKRDLEMLKAAGKVAFVGPSKTGYYEVVEVGCHVA